MAKKKQSLEQFLVENPFEQYHIEADILTPEEMRKHYSYLRTIANKRLSKFAGTEFEGAKSYTENKDKFVPLSEIENERQLRYKLYELNKFIRAESSSVTGLKRIRNRAIETAHERGMTWLNKSNIKQFGEYMDFLRSKYGAKQFDSERAQELFGLAIKKKIDPSIVADDFQFWRQHVDDLAEMPKVTNAQKKSVAEYKRFLEK